MLFGKFGFQTKNSFYLKMFIRLKRFIKRRKYFILIAYFYRGWPRLTLNFGLPLYLEALQENYYLSNEADIHLVRFCVCMGFLF